MIIEKIEMENFMCYYGYNCMEFREGINVVIGDNGYGKSKLYDAFYWVLYDQIYVPEKKEFQNTKLVKSKLISDKSKAECENGKITTTVTLTFHSSERDSVFILERKYTVDINSGRLIEQNDSEFNVMKRELSYLNARLVTDEEEIKKILNSILPANVKDYLWFQGEQVDSIIDFNKQDTLTKAINVLSSITRYDEIKDIAVSAAKSANAEYDREVKRLSKDTGLSERLEKEKLEIEEKLRTLYIEENEVRNNQSRAEERCEALLSKIGDASRITELQQKRKNKIQLLQSLNENLVNEQTSFHRKMFRNKWVLKGTEFLYEEFSERFSAYEKKKLEEATKLKLKEEAENELIKKMQTRLPIDVPEPIYVQRMLEEEKCLVCDREAKRDSEAWKKIKELLDNTSQSSKSLVNDELIKFDFGNDFKKLYQNGLVLSHRIKEIDSDINETLSRINSIHTKIRETNFEIKTIEDDLQKIISDSAQTIDTAENILAEYSIQNKYAKDYYDKLGKITQRIESYKERRRSLKEQLKDLVTGEIPKWLIEKKNICNDFESIAESTRDRVFNNLIEQLEREANKHYVAMTEGNKSVRGQVKLRKLPNGNYMPEITDNHGVPLTSSNTGNYKLVKFAAIMAIVSARSNEGLVSLYTLISDAPTSFMGEDYTIGFCKELSKVYRQSIILSYEFYKNKALRSELLTNPDIKIGKVYMVTPSISENERLDRKSLSTNIEALN